MELKMQGYEIESIGTEAQNKMLLQNMIHQRSKYQGRLSVNVTNPI